MDKKRKMVSSVFRNQEDTERAFDSLRTLGYQQNEIDVLISEKTRTDWYSNADDDDDDEVHEVGNKATEGIGVGGAVGTAIGATLGAVIAIGTTVALPGLGLIVAGPIVAALAGGGAGAVTGGLVGGLIGLGISEENAKAYQEVLRQGGAVIAVEPRSSGDVSKIEKVFSDHNGENIYYS
jgi:hypothetical protein